MLSRTTIRTARSVRLRTPALAKVSVRPNSTSAKQGGSTDAIAGGAIGAMLVLGVGYGYYHYSGAKVRFYSSREFKPRPYVNE